MKLRMKNDVEIVFRDWNDEFDHCKLILKKGLIIDVPQGEEEPTDFHPYQKFGKAYFITFNALDYEREKVIIEIIKESENDYNDPEEYRDMDASIYLHEDDVEII